MTTLVIRPRYGAGRSAAERQDAVARSLSALPSEISDQIEVIRGPEPGPRGTAAVQSAFVEAADAGAEERVRASLSKDVMIEPLIPFEKMTAPPARADLSAALCSAGAPFDLLRAGPLDLMTALQGEPTEQDYAGDGKTLEIVVKGPQGRRHAPVAFAEVHLVLIGANGAREVIQGRTDENGEARFCFAKFFEILAITVIPYSEYWPKMIRGGDARRRDVLCERLPESGPSGWWHRAIGLRADKRLGRAEGYDPIRIGVIDSGCGPHRAVEHVRDWGAFVRGERLADGGADSGTHGTFICGVIAGDAQNNPLPYFGVAPSAETHSVRVFPETGTANQGDIADAIDLLVEEAKVHVINLSLGSPLRSEILEQAIRHAFEKGVVCVCAAGNTAGPVAYPAAYRDTIAVSAFGELGAAPLDALPALPSREDLFTQRRFHAADFTNHGKEIALTCPGVGVIGPAPSRAGHENPYVSMNGTSVASPIAAAALAILLSMDPAYMSMGATRQRARYARNVLTSAACSIGLPREFEGCGAPIIREAP